MLTPNAIKAMLMFTAIPVTDPDPATPRQLEQGAGANQRRRRHQADQGHQPARAARHAVAERGVEMFSPSPAAPSPGASTSSGATTSCGAIPRSTTTRRGPSTSSGATPITWCGATASSTASTSSGLASHIVWGNDHIVWATDDHIVWGDSDHIVWGDSDHVVWGDSDHVVWGDSVVWRCSGSNANQERIGHHDSHPHSPSSTSVR